MKNHVEVSDPLASELLDQFDIETSHSVRVEASARATYSAARDLDLSGSRIIRLLFRLRGMPASSLNLDGLTRIRFKPLHEDPPNCFALGLIGQFWHPTGRLLDFDPSEFVATDRPGYAKAIWLFRVVPESERRCELKTLTRVHCMDGDSRLQFLRYWRVIGPFSGLVRRKALELARKAAEANPASA